MDPIADRRARVIEVASCRSAVDRTPALSDSNGVRECQTTYCDLIALVDAYDARGGSDPRAAAVIVSELARTARCDWYVPMFESRRAIVDHMGPDAADRLFRKTEVTPGDRRAAARALMHHRLRLTDHLLATQSPRELAWRALRRAASR